MRSALLLVPLAVSLALVACAGPPTPEEEFEVRAQGQWLLQFIVEAEAGSVYVDDHATWDTERDRYSLEVEAFLDEARTLPLLRYEAVFTYAVIGDSSTVTDGFDIDIRNESARMTALLDDPALYAALGLDDCDLVFDRAVDITGSACAAPSFRDGSCLEIDLYQVALGADEMYPAASEGNRCETRPTAADPSRPYRLVSRELP